MPDLHRFGSHRDQVAEAWMPVGGGRGPHPVVVVVHGGLWLDSYGRDLTHSVCADLAERGWLAWNLEYRRVGSKWSAGGWPATYADVAAGIDHLTERPDIADPGQVAVLGHSAGAPLAMWAAARPGLPDGAPGAHPKIAVRAAVSLSGVLDMVAAACDRRSVIGPGVVRFLGGRPDEVPDRYALASPVERLPLGLPQLVVHGTNDGTVPPEQSEDYARRACEAGDPVDLRVVPRASHMELVDPRSPAWDIVARWLSSAPGGFRGPDSSSGG
jgi:acetyl esterase/lipase